MGEFPFFLGQIAMGELFYHWFKWANFYGVPSVKDEIACNLAEIACNLAKLQISCNLAKLQISCNLAKLQITRNLAKLLQFVKLHCNCHGYGLWNVANQNCRKNCIWNQAFRGSRTVRYCRKTRPNVWMLSDGCSCSDVCLAERFKGQVIVRLFSLIN